eukprot:scaffold5694_cov124-Isochrysis_galbana.AAC.2
MGTGHQQPLSNRRWKVPGDAHRGRAALGFALRGTSVHQRFITARCDALMGTLWNGKAGALRIKF